MLSSATLGDRLESEEISKITDMIRVEIEMVWAFGKDERRRKERRGLG